MWYPTDNVQNRMMYEVHDYLYTYAIMTEDDSWGNMDYYWGKDHQNIYINGVERLMHLEHRDHNGQRLQQNEVHLCQRQRNACDIG